MPVCFAWKECQICYLMMLNSLLPTGTLIRRHRIPLPPPNDEQFYTVENFNIGQEIALYSRTFKITVSKRALKRCRCAA